MKRAIYYDTETTGISPKKDRIIEIAAYDATRDTSFSSLINPNMPIPAEATNIHHITDEMVKDSPTFEVVGTQFAEFCSGDVVLIAHNNDGFDKHFLKHEYERSGLTLPDWPYIDTLKWSRKYRPDLPKHSLQHLRQLHQIEANNAHRALDDVVILHQVFSQMIGDLTIEQVITLMGEKRPIRTMPFGKHRGEALQSVPKSYITWLSKGGAFDKPENQELKENFEALGLL